MNWEKLLGPLSIAGLALVSACTSNKASESPTGDAHESESGSRFEFAGDSEDASPAGEPGQATGEAPAGPCEVEVSIWMQEEDGGSLKVATKFSNKTDKPLSLKWTAKCPSAGMAYQGIVSEYDFGNTCAAGVCMGSEDHYSLELGPGLEATAAPFLVEPPGGRCNKPLAAGSYSLSATSEITGAKVCPAQSGTFSVAAGKATLAK